MNKKIFTLISILFISLTGIIIFILLPTETQTIQKKQEMPVEQKQNNDTNEKELDEDDINEDEEQKDEQETSEGTVKKAIIEIVHSTIDFFTNKDLNIVAVGDSLTQGVGDSQDQGGYVGIIDRTINEEKKHAKVQNFGKRGDRTDQLLVRLDDPKVATSVSEADIILMTVGANDIMQIVKKNFTHLTYEQFANEREDYEERLNAILDRLKSLNDDADIYLIGFYNPFDKYFPDIEELGIIVNDWNDIGKKVTRDYPQVYYIPIKDLFKDEEIDLFADDHFHPNDTGYERIARRVLTFITEEDR